jgi:GTPase
VRTANASREVSELAEQILDGDRRALARAITTVESTRPDHRDEAAALLTEVLPHTGGAVRIGISGAPGSGKSTFIEALGLSLIDHGHRVAVLAVDPSSTRTGGSILGDKTRMGDLTRSDSAFVRPSPTAGTLGGVARRTREAMLLCEAAGFDVVMVETVGVGQSEVAVAGMVDLFAVLVAPGAGDELQGIKRGIIELADVVVVNKNDGELAPAAKTTATEYSSALRLVRSKTKSWTPLVVLVSALEGAGIDGLWSTVEEFRSTLDATGELDRRRAEQAREWMWSEVSESLMDALRNDERVSDLADRLEAAVTAGELPPAAAARQILDAFLRAEN